MHGHMELICFKATSGLPLEFAFPKSFMISLGGLVVSEPKQCHLIGESHQITWGLGRIRTNAMPLDRRKPPDHLGTWSCLNQSRLLIGLRPQSHLGAWSNPNQCNATWPAYMPRCQ